MAPPNGPALSSVELEARPHEIAFAAPVASVTACNSGAATVARSNGRQRVLKRSFDLTFALIGLLLLLPLMLLISVAIVIASPGSPVFRHRRVGRDGKEFRMLKFRTMCVDAEQRLHADADMYAQYLANDFKLDLREDDRVFPLGRLLRKISLDELPQLINVVLGQMSLVGPRPVERAQLPVSYGPMAAIYLSTRPGITGRWQVNGRSHVKFPERALLDADYVANWTFWTDIVILLQTVPSVVRRNGSH